MKKMPKSFFLIPLFFFTSIISTNNYAFAIYFTDSTQSDLRDSVLKEAQKSLLGFLNLIPAGYETVYGFKNRSEVENAYVESPMQIYSISTEFFNSLSDSFEESICPTSDWKVFVMAEGNAKTFLQVSICDNIIKAVDLGGANLAVEIFEKVKNYRGSNHIYLLRVYQIEEDVLLIVPLNKGISTAKVLPLNSAMNIKAALKLSPNSLTDLKSLVTVLKQIYNSQMK